MGSVLTTAATMMCPHGGTVIPTSTNAKALAGAAILRPSDMFTIAGCVLNVSGAPHPCMLVEWQMPSAKVQADGGFALTTDSIGMCKAGDQAVQGVVMIQSTQMKVSAR